MTSNTRRQPSASILAREIKEQIFSQTGLTASAGVAPNKFLAKVASDLEKPDGLTIIPPERVEEVLRSLPVRKIPGIGQKTEEKMKSLGLHTTYDLRQKTEEELCAAFGKHG